MKVLFTTGYARNAIVHAGRLDTGVELLPKPFSYAALSARVREVLDKGLGERVLVVEASDSAKGVTAELLNSVGFVVEEAATPREALGKLRAAARYFNAAILDGELPLGRIDALITEIRAARDDLPILITTRDNGGKLRKAYAHDRCTAVLTKPFDRNKLRDALGKLQVGCREQSDEL